MAPKKAEKPKKLFSCLIRKWDLEPVRVMLSKIEVEKAQISAWPFIILKNASAMLIKEAWRIAGSVSACHAVS